MPDLSCLCGAVRLTPAKRPDFVHACNCTLCSKSGAHWGYFHPDEVTVSGETRHFSRTDKTDPAAQVHFCPTCGTTTHFTLTPWAAEKFGNTMMGVNMRLADEADLAGIELRFPDGAGWQGEGEFAYLRDAWVYGVK